VGLIRQKSVFAEEVPGLQILEYDRAPGAAGRPLHLARLDEVHRVARVPLKIDDVAALVGLRLQSLNQFFQLDTRQAAQQRNFVQMRWHEASFGL
jgi:hypothetical protein